MSKRSVSSDQGSMSSLPAIMALVVLPIVVMTLLVCLCLWPAMN